MTGHLLNTFSEPEAVPQFFRAVHYSASWHILFHYLILTKKPQMLFTNEKIAILIIKQFALDYIIRTKTEPE